MIPIPEILEREIPLRHLDGSLPINEPQDRRWLVFQQSFLLISFKSLKTKNPHHFSHSRHLKTGSQTNRPFENADHSKCIIY